eukprot:jgi/Mesvir1/3883/Mv19835-RA.1
MEITVASKCIVPISAASLRQHVLSHAVGVLPLASKHRNAGGKAVSLGLVSSARPRRHLVVSASLPGADGSEQHHSGANRHVISAAADAMSVVFMDGGDNKARAIYEEGGNVGGEGGDSGNRGSGGGGGGGGGGNWGGNDGSSGAGDLSASISAALSGTGRSLESFPADLVTAVQSGRAPVTALKNYMTLEKRLFLGSFLKFSGFRDRLLADPVFLAKLGIEWGVGIFTKTGAEYNKRQDHFFHEWDFVLANVIMALIADFMLVWLPAPTIGLGAAAAGAKLGWLGRIFAGCPDNAFQKVMGNAHYTVGQRTLAIVRNGGKLMAVGTVASFIGTGTTNLLLQARKLLSGGGFKHENDEQDVVKMGLCYGSYMALSSNLRYQVLAGVLEQRILEPLIKKELPLTIACFLLRTANTFLGSLLWVDYVRLMGLQKSAIAIKKEAEAKEAAAKEAAAKEAAAKEAAAREARAKAAATKGKGKSKVKAKA